MHTFQEAPTLSEPTGDAEIDRYALSYMGGLVRDRIHQLILEAFIESGLTQAQLARRLGMDPARISKILGTSSNVTAETFGEVMFAIDGSCARVERDWPLRAPMTNLTQPVWFADCIDRLTLTSTTSANLRPVPVSTTPAPTFNRQVSAGGMENA